MAIYICLVLALGVATIAGGSKIAGMALDIPGLFKIVFLGVAMMLIGLWDDLSNLRPWLKFSAQVVVALMCWVAG